jgi:hypothetical protein
MKRGRYQTSLIRAAGAIVIGPMLAVFAALSLSWAAFPALGEAEGFDVFVSHLQAKGVDYGPGYTVGLLAWLICDRVGVRDAKYAVVIGALSFYVGSRLFALIYLAQDSYWSWDYLPRLFVPRISELVFGSVLAIVMWAVAYWSPSAPARSAAGT